MRRATLIFVCFVILFMLSSCEKRNEKIMDKALAYVEENEGLLRACAQELLDIISEEKSQNSPDVYYSYQITLQADSSLLLRDYLTDELIDIQSDSCRAVLNGDIIHLISIHHSNDSWIIEFSCGGSGIGSNTVYYDIQYVSSREAADLWGYDSDMSFVKKDKGFLGHAVDGDNSFFFYQITEDFYYTEASY